MTLQAMVKQDVQRATWPTRANVVCCPKSVIPSGGPRASASTSAFGTTHVVQQEDTKLSKAQLAEMRFEASPVEKTKVAFKVRCTR